MTVPIRIGRPTQAKSKNPNAPTPRASAASDTMMLTGLPVSTNSEPALPANTIGINILDDGRPMRSDTITAIGNSAATAPLRLIKAVSRAHRPITATRSRPGESPARATRRDPAHVVTPDRSMPSLTTNRAAMKMTTGSPNPAVASSSANRSVAHRASMAPRATIPTGRRFHTNSPMTPPRIRRACVDGLTG